MMSSTPSSNELKRIPWSSSRKRRRSADRRPHTLGLGGKWDLQYCYVPRRPLSVHYFRNLGIENVYTLLTLCTETPYMCVYHYSSSYHHLTTTWYIYIYIKNNDARSKRFYIFKISRYWQCTNWYIYIYWETSIHMIHTYTVQIIILQRQDIYIYTYIKNDFVNTCVDI